MINFIFLVIYYILMFISIYFLLMSFIDFFFWSHDSINIFLFIVGLVVFIFSIRKIKKRKTVKNKTDSTHSSIDDYKKYDNNDNEHQNINQEDSQDVSEDSFSPIAFSCTVETDNFSVENQVNTKNTIYSNNESEQKRGNSNIINDNFLLFALSPEKYDNLLLSAARLVIYKNKATIGMIQREYNIGFNRASQIISQLHEIGIVDEEDGIKPRKVLMSPSEFEIASNLICYEPKEEDHPDENLAPERIRMYDNKFDYMEGHDFEYYCAELLKAIGYSSVEVTPGSNDNGIDILATKGGVKYGIQCKCYSSDIGVKAVQEAFSGAAYYSCHVPVVLTNRHFTRQAQELAEKTNVLLWDRSVLELFVSTYTESHPHSEIDR